jgi:hypothetical protein
MAKTIYHPSVEVAQHSAKNLADAQNSNYMRQSGDAFNQANEAKQTFEKAAKKLDGHGKAEHPAVSLPSTGFATWVKAGRESTDHCVVQLLLLMVTLVGAVRIIVILWDELRRALKRRPRHRERRGTIRR